MLAHPSHQCGANGSKPEALWVLREDRPYLLYQLHQWLGLQLLDLGLVHAGLVVTLGLALGLARHVGSGVFYKTDQALRKGLRLGQERDVDASTSPQLALGRRDAVGSAWPANQSPPHQVPLRGSSSPEHFNGVSTAPQTPPCIAL